MSEAQAASPVVAATALEYAWRRGGARLRFPPFNVARGEKLFVHGASGSGKSTLLGLLAGVLQPAAGSVRVLGAEVPRLRRGARDRFRAEHIGYVFQQFNLLPFLDVAANVALACRFSRTRQARATLGASLDTEIDRLLAALELDAAMLRRRAVGELSVGQQQRVAAARALIGGPELLIADEPTSALDADARAAFIQLLLAECARHRTSVVFVSHDLQLARHFDRSLRLAA